LTAAPLPPRGAFYDLHYLLARGYPRSRALELVAARHGLSRRQRLLLGRCVHPPLLNRKIRAKILEPNAAEGSCIAVDAYNQLATIYAALSGETIYRCTDGLLRDSLLGATGLVTRHAQQLAEIMAASLRSLNPSHVVFVVDAQPSHSGRLAGSLRSAATSYGLSAETILARKADRETLSQAQACLVASSDIVIAKKARRLIDLAAHTVSLTGTWRTITDITPIIERAHREWCGGPVA
jgi:hypothetical protein